jgi:hypothetical protein
MTMIVLVVVAFALVVIVTVFAWPAVEEPKPADEQAPVPDPEPKPESLEGVLVKQLLNEEISPRQYLHAMRFLAERDADRHPLLVPPDD